jgi:hypothetical protein
MRSRKPFTSKAIAYLKGAIPPEEPEPGVSLSGENAIVFRDLKNGLFVCYVVDTGDEFEFVQQRHLTEDGIDDNRLHSIGIANLGDLVAEQGLSLVPHPEGILFGVLFGGNFEASLILLDFLWEDAFREFVSGDYVIAVPGRDILAFCDASSAEGLQELREAIELRKEADATHLISDDLYVRRDGKWEILASPRAKRGKRSAKDKPPFSDLRCVSAEDVVGHMHSDTDEDVDVRADILVRNPEGGLIVEAMFSSVVDLSDPAVNLAPRIHPAKARVFEAVVTGQCRLTVRGGSPDGSSPFAPGESFDTLPDVQFHVNQPDGGILKRHFSEFLDRSRELLERGACDEVRSTITLPGFDPDAEPILREIRDGSLLLIFGYLPPLVIESDPAKAQQFDLDAFGEELEKAAGVSMIWDDREVFVIKRPTSRTIDRIRQFLVNYWSSKKPTRAKTKPGKPKRGKPKRKSS